MPPDLKHEWFPGFGGSPPGGGTLELEDGSGLIELEDGSGTIILES